MAEISVGKGRDVVARIESTSQQPGGLARPLSAPPRSEDRPRRQGEETEELLVEIGEEARRNLEEEQAEAAASPQGETDKEKRKEQGAIVDVVV